MFVVRCSCPGPWEEFVSCRWGGGALVGGWDIVIPGCGSLPYALVEDALAVGGEELVGS